MILLWRQVVSWAALLCRRGHKLVLAELRGAGLLERLRHLYAERGYDHDGYRDQVRALSK